MTPQHQIVKIESVKVWVTRLPSLSHPPLSIESPASRRKMRVLREAVLARGDWPLLYDKLAISNTYSHAKNRNDPRPITLSKVAFLESGFSAVAILGGGWLQSPDSDGPPWMCCVWHQTASDATIQAGRTRVIFFFLNYFLQYSRKFAVWSADRVPW